MSNSSKRVGIWVYELKALNYIENDFAAQACGESDVCISTRYAISMIDDIFVVRPSVFRCTGVGRERCLHVKEVCVVMIKPQTPNP